MLYTPMCFYVQALSLAESRPYHILRNNCIHFADAMVRLLTGGSVRSAPLIYDLVCGEVPAVDPPVVLLAQAMLQLPWTTAVDGTPLYQALVLGAKTPTEGDATAHQPASATPVAPSSVAAPEALMDPAALLSSLMTPPCAATDGFSFTADPSAVPLTSMPPNPAAWVQCCQSHRLAP